MQIAKIRRLSWLATLLLAVACSHGGAGVGPTPPDSTATAPKPDPYVTVRVRSLIDTTTAPGRAHWHAYYMLTGPQSAKDGFGYEGAISLVDIRLGHNKLCVRVGADSVGERLLSVVAFADTTTEALTPDSLPDRLARQWYNGTTTMPAGYAAVFNTPVDAWTSAQYTAGHGRTMDDPIRWGLDWIRADSVHLYEIPQPDTTACNLV